MSQALVVSSLLPISIEIGTATTTAWGWFLDKVAPSLIVGVVIAIVGSYLLPRANERYKGQRDHLNQAVDNLRAQLDALQKAAAEYWGAAPGPASHVQEADIEFRLQDVGSLFQSCGAGVGGSSNSLITELALETVTENFGTPGRIPEPDRARLIAVLASRVASAAALERHRYFSENWLSKGWSLIGRRRRLRA